MQKLEPNYDCKTEVFLFFSGLMFCLIDVGCAGGGSSSASQQNGNVSTPVQSIYVAGKDSDTGQAINIWKNGSKISTIPVYSDKTSMTVCSSDVYVSTMVTSGPNLTHTYTIWKNGVLNSTLSPVGSTVEALAVSGVDVYVAGKDSDTGQAINIWKNGSKISTIPVYSDKTSMTVCSGDVYVSTMVTSGPNLTHTYTIWKNGVLNSTLSPAGSTVEALAVSGVDVYVAGKDSDTGQAINIWKNGSKISTIPVYSDKTSMTVCSGDVYVSTMVTSGPNLTHTYTIWKNGVLNSTLSPAGSTVEALASVLM